MKGCVSLIGVWMLALSALAPSTALADGELDLSFGSGGYGVASTVGITEVEVGGDGDMRVDDVAVAPSGKVVIAGLKPPPNANAAVVVLNANGTVDTGFSGNGFASAEFADNVGLSDRADAVVVQPDGKIVVAGSADSSGADNLDVWMARFETDGDLDPTFSPGGDPGEAQFNFSGAEDEATALLLLPGGDFLVAGRSSGGDGDPLLLRVNSTGGITNAFGGDGVTSADFGAANEYLNDIAVQPDGDVVGVGGEGDESTLETAAKLYRFQGDTGAPDDTFSDDGTLNLDLATAAEELNAVALRSDGKIVAVGTAGDDTSPLTDSDTVVARVTPVGEQDNSFAGDGVLTQQMPLTGFGVESGGMDLRLQGDGKLLIAVRSNFDAWVLRYLPAGSLDPSFAGEGVFEALPPSNNKNLQALELSGASNVVAAGDLQRPDFTGSNPYAVRLVHTTPQPAAAVAAPPAASAPAATKKKCKKGRKLRKGKCVKKKKKKR